MVKGLKKLIAITDHHTVKRYSFIFIDQDIYININTRYLVGNISG